MAEFTFDEIMRTGHVKRWQIVRTAREQTIAEHMYRVWAITSLLVKAIEAPESIKFAAQSWALVHDTPEVITGDIATPAKEAMRNAIPNTDPIHNIELELSDMYRSIWQESKRVHHPDWPTPYEIVKIADLIEAACFLGCEGIGPHATIVHSTLTGKVQKLYSRMINIYPLVSWGKAIHIVNKVWEKV